ncbi:MAG: diguanylate cyclase [Gammaproteobacteria bacterium]|nr:diguanylate cyclase [Gammaproteobacteria bacterium]MBV8307125.1 diguanylate cyclase [Gammaproteobacteria bacterium]MBV8403492.1 diguanylate cyclase [Gammaproteobacteria bacterium]
MSGGSVPSGGHTTVIQRILERRAQRLPVTHEETTATIAVMLRVVPPPKTLLVCQDLSLRRQLERRIAAALLECESSADEDEALARCAAEHRALIVTDSLELIRRLRARLTQRAPFVIYLAGLDEPAARAAGLAAGADECLGRRAAEQELDARLACARRIAELEAVLRVTLAENRKLSATDDLTRLASRRFFSKHFPREVERAARYGRALSLILCDIDLFKGINDSLGHAAGDQILRQFGARLQKQLRRGIDWVARIGGEEFAVVLPETGYEAALEVARKLRAAIAQTQFTSERKGIGVTASFGLCGLDRVPAGERRLAERVLKIADAALYRSKHSGRNRVTATMFNAGSE